MELEQIIESIGIKEPKNLKQRIEDIARHCKGDVTSVTEAVTKAAYWYFLGLELEHIEKRYGELALSAEKLLQPARKLKNLWDKMPEEVRDPFDWHYSNETTGGDSVEAYLAARARPLLEKPVNPERSFGDDLQHMVEVFDRIARNKLPPGRQPDFARHGAIGVLWDYWKDQLGNKSMSTSFVAFAGEVIALFGDAKHVGATVETLRQSEEFK